MVKDVRTETRVNWQGARRLPHVGELAAMLAPPRPFARPTARRLAGAVDIADLRRLARRRTPRPVFDFVDGGAGDESALRGNAHSFDSVRLVPRTLRDVSRVDTSTSVLGSVIDMPVVLAPIGMMRISHTHGEIGAARAAGRAGVPWTMSTMASTTPESLAEYASDAQRWFQLYLWRDAEASRRLVERASRAGFTTLVLTVDVPVAGARLRDVRNGMTLPPSLTLSSVAQIAMHPRWWWDVVTREPIANKAVEGSRGDFMSRTNSVMDPSVTLDHLRTLRDIWPGRILVKGVLDPRDAADLVTNGADGVIVSNHGGRQLENSVAPLDVLPAVRHAVGPSVPVLVDGGVRSGAHIAAAIAAGADAVMVGRAYVYGLMAAGESGVDRAIELLRSGLLRAMALLGARSVGELRPDMVHRSHTGE